MIIALLSAASSVHTIRWANAFVERGHTVHLISLHAPGSGLDQRVNVHRMALLGGLGYLMQGPAIAKLLRRIGPDVVNAHYATGYGTLVRWCGAFPLVLNVWGSDVFAFPDKSMLHKSLLRSNLRRADQLVSTSLVMAERTRHFAGPSQAITVVPFGVDLDRFNARPAREKGSRVVIGTVKTLEPVYGVDRLVEAFILLFNTERGADLHLRIVGEGSERATLEARSMAAGLADRVTFVGAVSHDNVPAELNHLDIYVALSRSESFGVAVIEASACGLPVVVSDAGGLPEVVQHVSTGFVVQGGDPVQAAEALAALVRDADLRQRMGQAGREFVVENYAWSHCVDRMLAVLEEVRAQRQGS